MSNENLINSFKEQIHNWDREIKNIEDMIEATYYRIDECDEGEYKLVHNLREQINQWTKDVENIEDMREETYIRIDELKQFKL